MEKQIGEDRQTMDRHIHSIEKKLLSGFQRLINDKMAILKMIVWHQKWKIRMSLFNSFYVTLDRKFGHMVSFLDKLFLSSLPLHLLLFFCSPKSSWPSSSILAKTIDQKPFPVANKLTCTIIAGFHHFKCNLIQLPIHLSSNTLKTDFHPSIFDRLSNQC